MSHDIVAISDNERVAELFFNAGDRIIAGFTYRCLNAQEFDAGISGIDDGRSFTIEEIRKAKEALEYYKDEPIEQVRDAAKDAMEKEFITNLFGHYEEPERLDDEKIKELAIGMIGGFLDKILAAKIKGSVYIKFS